MIGTVDVIGCYVTWTLRDFTSLRFYQPFNGTIPTYESPPFSVFGNECCFYLAHFPGGYCSDFFLKYMSGYWRSGLSVRSIRCRASLFRYGQLSDHAAPSSITNSWLNWSKFLRYDELVDTDGYRDNNRVSIHVQLFPEYEILDCPHEDLNSSHDTCPTIDHLSAAFKKWHEDRVCTDMTVEVGGENFEIHKFVFASRSEVFYRMFSQNMSESNTRSMKISDLVPEVFRQLVEYMYTGEVLGLKDSASDLLYTAEKYGLEDLKGICVEALKKTITKDTALNVLSLADLHRAQELKNFALSFVKKHGQEVTLWEGWTNLLTNKPDLATEVVRTLVPTSSTATVNPPPSKMRKTVSGQLRTDVSTTNRL